MPRPKTHEERELDRLEAGIQVKIRQKEQELETLRSVLEAVQAARSAVADATRYLGNM